MDRVVCVNLGRRPDRWEEFCGRWNGVMAVERVEAVDGAKCEPPAWWKQGRGAWGCYRSHLAVIEQALMLGQESVLFFEDDAVPCEGFAEKYAAAMRALPENWEMMYIGGQHLKQQHKEPTRVNDYWDLPYNVNRTHAYALKGSGLQKAYKHLNETKSWRTGHHIDHHYGVAHMHRSIITYSARPWLVGQAESHSDIKNRTMPTRFWKGNVKVVVVLGLHRSGSSCLAGVLHRLGVHMGDRFVGCEPDGGHEAAWLARLCESVMKFPSIKVRPGWQRRMQVELKKYYEGKELCGIKYPHLCAFAATLEELLGNRMVVVCADRPLEASVASLIRREGRRKNAKDLEAVQQFLWASKERFLASTKRPVHRVDYSRLLEDPDGETRRLADFLGVEFSPEAAVYVDASRCHIRTS